MFTRRLRKVTPFVALLPMALTVIIALVAAFVLSLTFVPALLAIWLSKPVEEKEGRIMSWLKRRYEPGLSRAMARPRTRSARASAVASSSSSRRRSTAGCSWISR